MSNSIQPSTGYSVCTQMLAAIESEIKALKAHQARRGEHVGFASQVEKLARACASLQGEIRKTGDNADKAAAGLSPARKVELILKMIKDMSPEHRVAVLLYLEELGTKLL